MPVAVRSAAAAVSQASDYAAVVEQPLSDGSTVTLQLIYDPTSPYGWLVDSIAPGA